MPLSMSASGRHRLSKPRTVQGSTSSRLLAGLDYALLAIRPTIGVIQFDFVTVLSSAAAKDSFVWALWSNPDLGDPLYFQVPNSSVEFLVGDLLTASGGVELISGVLPGKSPLMKEWQHMLNLQDTLALIITPTKNMHASVTLNWRE